MFRERLILYDYLFRGAVLGGIKSIRRAHYKKALPHFIEKFKYLPKYGLANYKDFGETADAIACLCAYNDKQYYLYKAVGDKTKIGYLSRKQYRKFIHKVNDEDKEEWLKNNGRMVSLYKLLNRAIDENKYARLLNVFRMGKQINDDIKKVRFEEFAMLLHNYNNGCVISECTIQEAYDMDLISLENERGYGRGSGERYATRSCMQGMNCEPYYKAFGAKAFKVNIQGVDVGRFLVWETAKGKTYVDRLYCNGADAEEALTEIEKKFGDEDVVYYPSRIDDDDYVKCLDIEAMGEDTYKPYVDSFKIMLYRKKERLLFLQQSAATLPYDNYVSSGSYHPHLKFCKCGELLLNNNKKLHDFICPFSTVKLRQKKDFVRIYQIFEERRNEPLY